jgi:hypothetical protein
VVSLASVRIHFRDLHRLFDISACPAAAGWIGTYLYGMYDKTLSY